MIFLDCFVAVITLRCCDRCSASASVFMKMKSLSLFFVDTLLQMISYGAISVKKCDVETGPSNFEAYTRLLLN